MTDEASPWYDDAGDVRPEVYRAISQALASVQAPRDYLRAAKAAVRSLPGIPVTGRLPAKLSEAIDQVVEVRACRWALRGAPAPSLQARLQTYLVQSYAAELAKHTAALQVIDHDPALRATLVGAAGLRFLCGHHADGSRWVGAVDTRIDSVEEAWHWVIPAPVWHAVTHRRRIEVFGSVVLVEHPRGPEDLSHLPTGYAWNARTRTLLRADGSARRVPFPVRAYATGGDPTSPIPAPTWLVHR